MLLAASTQRTIGLVILAIVLIGGLVYILFNILAARDEVGSEIELAANRRPYVDDEELEGRTLDLALGWSLVLLTIVAISLPLYWLGEPGRHQGRIDDSHRIFADRGGELYNGGAQCVNCHGADGAGGSVNTVITTESGDFIAQVNWKAPALDTVLSRFTEDEVLHTLNFGRNGVMPAWGAPGGGPLTQQQLQEIIFYLRRIQIDEETIHEQVSAGVRSGVEDLLLGESDEDWAVEVRGAEEAKSATAHEVRLAGRADFDFSCTDNDADVCVADTDAGAALLAAQGAAQAPLAEAVDDWLDEATAVRELAWEMALDSDSTLDDPGNEQLWRNAAVQLLSIPGGVPGQERFQQYGEILFTNQAASGTYSCARCHTFGWSYDATSELTIEDNGHDGVLLDEYVQGGGFFGPSLVDGNTLDQFETAGSHAAFIGDGQTIGVTYGRGGSGGNGQMPGFGANTESNPIGPGFTTASEFSYPALLTEEQIDAIVAFERNL